jgi:dihydroorotate dehydrogenase electron transfer subunit
VNGKVPETGRIVPKLHDFTATVTEKKKIAPSICAMTLNPLDIKIEPAPGQFFMVRSWETKDPLLSRPLAASGTRRDGSIEILFRIRGRGTTLLAECQKGQTLFMRGPCGNGFPKPAGGRLLLAAGAMGVAPLLFARERFGREKNMLLFVGVSGQSEWEPFCRNISRRFPETLFFSENGAIGEKGTVIDGLRNHRRRNDEIWACGPEGMLRALKYFQDDRSPAIRVSLERRMACGYGGCLGCAIQTRSGPKRVCVDGPVFRWEELCWHES